MFDLLDDELDDETDELRTEQLDAEYALLVPECPEDLAVDYRGVRTRQMKLEEAYT